MKSFIVFALLVAAVAAAPAGPDASAETIRASNDNIGVREYSYLYETSNGIKQNEQGALIEVGTEDEGIAVRGQFSYVGPDGITYEVTYTADKNGFRAAGAHIPQA